MIKILTFLMKLNLMINKVLNKRFAMKNGIIMKMVKLNGQKNIQIVKETTNHQ
jgi:hypothetical protein